MICTHCLTELPAGAMFCGECGRRVTAKTSVAAQPVERPMPVPTPRVAPAEVDDPAETIVVEDAEDVVDESDADGIDADGTDESDADEIDAEIEPDDEPPAEPELVVEAEPQAEPEAEIETEPDLEPAPSDALTCEQCGAALSPADIFCGECGFVSRHVTVHEIPVVTVPPSGQQRDTAVIPDPFPWGETPPAEPLPPPTLSPMAPLSPLDDDVDETRLVSRRATGERFVLQFSTGDSFTVYGSGLLGRKPVAEPGEYVDHLVTIVDPGKSVSKTHLEFGQSNGAFWVSDRYSANGSRVREPDTEPKRCDPGKRYQIVRGSRVDIGEQFFVVS